MVKVDFNNKKVDENIEEYKDESINPEMIEYLMNIFEKILEGYEISKEEAYKLSIIDGYTLGKFADQIREKFLGNTFDVCSIINGKSGKCSENCKFCAQSAHYNTNVSEYSLLDKETILKEAIHNDSKGVLRFSIVVSGKKLSDKDVDVLVDVIKEIKEKTNISVCASLGLLSHENFQKLKKAGLERVHNNLETSEDYFENICTTHSYKDKINALKAAQNEGLEVCSGGIIGMGETIIDRINMAFDLRDLKVSSIPINILNPIKGTPLENVEQISKEEIIKTCALFRFINPKSFIRLAGGRKLLDDKGELAFMSGINAVITGDMLTTEGISIDTDMSIISKLGYKVALG